MSSWSMNDGSDLTGTITTNTSSGTQMNVAGSGTAFTTEVAVGDVILTAGGNSYRVKSITSNTALVLTENVTSAESGVAADVRSPPLDFDSAAPHINTNILGVSAAESLGGLAGGLLVGLGRRLLDELLRRAEVLAALVRHHPGVLLGALAGVPAEEAALVLVRQHVVKVARGELALDDLALDDAEVLPAEHTEEGG